MTAEQEAELLAGAIAELEQARLTPAQAAALEELKASAKLPSPPPALRPANSALLQNFPNPFNPETWIPYQLTKDADVTIRIFNASGQLAQVLEIRSQKAGAYHTREKAAYWDGKNAIGEKVSSGVYFYTLRAGDFHATRRMVILK
jgi:hypothetical protein